MIVRNTSNVIEEKLGESIVTLLKVLWRRENSEIENKTPHSIEWGVG